MKTQQKLYRAAILLKTLADHSGDEKQKAEFLELADACGDAVEELKNHDARTAANANIAGGHGYDA